MQYYLSFCNAAPKFNNGLSEQSRRLEYLADKLEVELDDLRGQYRIPLTDRGEANYPNSWRNRPRYPK